MEKNVSSVAEQDKTAEVKKNPKLIELARPYKFDDKEYTEIDLSGLDDLTIKDAVLIQQLETTNRSLEVVTAQNKKQDDRLTALEKAPGVFGNKLWWAVIAALIAGFVASELARYLH